MLVFHNKNITDILIFRNRARLRKTKEFRYLFNHNIGKACHFNSP